MNLKQDLRGCHLKRMGGRKMKKSKDICLESIYVSNQKEKENTMSQIVTKTDGISVVITPAIKIAP